MSTTTFSPAATVAGLLAAARRHGLELVTDRDELDTMGLDFLVLHAHDQRGVPWVVRTPRRADVVESACIEARVLKVVRPVLAPIAAPDWRVYADDVIAYPRLPGTPAVTMAGGVPQWNIIDPAAPSRVFLEALASALAALQGISVERAKEGGVPVVTIDGVRAELARAAETTRSALEPSAALWERWQRWLDEDTTWPERVAMTHGDLHPGHLLLEEGGALTGILDWTEGKISDPGIDFATVYGCFGEAAMVDVIRMFEEKGGVTWPALAAHAAERWAFSAALGAAWALKNNNTFVLELSKTMMPAE